MASKSHNLLKATLHKKKKKKSLRLLCLFGDQNLRCCSTQWLGLSFIGRMQHCVCSMWCLQNAKIRKGNLHPQAYVYHASVVCGDTSFVDVPILALRENLSNKVQVRWKKAGAGWRI